MICYVSFHTKVPLLSALFLSIPMCYQMMHQDQHLMSSPHDQHAQIVNCKLSPLYV
jgi:hypothetical protein